MGVTDTEITILASCLEADPKHRPNDARVLANRLAPTTGAQAPPPKKPWMDTLTMVALAPWC